MTSAAALAAVGLLASAVAAAADVVPPSGKALPEVVVTLAWDYRGIPDGMRVYEPAPGAAQLPLWHTARAARFKDIPAGEEVAAGAVKMRPGSKRRLLLVYHNETASPVRFFASPHHVHPDESSLGFEFACLCMNHVYTAPPSGYWWRVVELMLDDDFEATTLDVRHALVAPGRKRG